MNKPITPEEMTAYIEATWNKCQEKAWQEPKREWVEITKGECDELFRTASDHIEYAYAIERKLKEKNA